MCAKGYTVAQNKVTSVTVSSQGTKTPSYLFPKFPVTYFHLKLISQKL